MTQILQLIRIWNATFSSHLLRGDWNVSSTPHSRLFPFKTVKNFHPFHTREVQTIVPSLKKMGKTLYLIRSFFGFFLWFLFFFSEPCFTKVKTEWEFYRHITVKCYHPAHSYFVKNFSNCNSNFCKDSVVNKSDKRKSWFVPLQNFLWVNVTEQWCCLTTGVSGGREPHIVKWEP